ncbi:MAG: hypothetical protein AB8V92_03170 [Coxiella endosymbiont of Dermacentor nuttalli]
MNVNVKHWCWIKFNIDDIIKLEHWNSFFHKFSHFELEIKPILLQAHAKALQLIEGKSQIWYKENSLIPGGIAAPVAWLLKQLKSNK